MFQLESVTQVLCTNANPRRELHGEDRVRAMDLSFVLTGENTLLDLIQPGLRAHHYFNAAVEARQEPLPLGPIPLPDLRYPKLPLAYSYAHKEKSRGYRFIWDYGTQEARVDFTDVVLHNLHYEIMQGGSCKIFWTLQYNGDELGDNDVYGELSGLASEGEMYIKLLAPAQLISVKRGYRAGRPDVNEQPRDPNQQQLGGDDDDGHVGEAGAFQGSGDTEDDVLHADGSPEAALAGTEKKTVVH